MIEIFRVGTQTDSQGVTRIFTEQDLIRMAEVYDPTRHEAPLVVGHPTTDAPAYGWVKRMQAGDGRLAAEPHQVDPAFAEWVAAGRYKKVSVALYLPEAKTNPAPGSYYLRHVGFLGAEPPAVKGLRTPTFADGGEGIIVFEDSAIQAGLWRRLREWLIAKFGMEEADRVVPDWEVTALAAAPATDAPGAAGFGEGHTGTGSPHTGTGTATTRSQEGRGPGEGKEGRMTEALTQAAALAERDAALAERERQVAAKEAAVREASARLREAAYRESLDGLIREGKVRPAHKAGLVALMMALPAETTLTYGEGEETRTSPALDWLKAYLTAQPPLVAFGEAAPAGASVNRDDAAAIARAAQDHQAREAQAGRTLSIADAVHHVLRA